MNNSSFNFKRFVALVAVVAVLGGGSLGIGLGIGFAVAGQLNPPVISPVLEESPTYNVLPVAEERTEFRFSDLESEMIPVEVRISDITSVVQTVSGSVVSINIETPSANPFFPTYVPGSGSGIIFAEDDNFLFIATNNHVIQQAARISVSLDDEHDVEASVIGGDWHADLAVLSVPRAEFLDKDYKIAVFGDSDNVLVGDEVVAIGNPLGQGQTATRGIISAVNRQITVDDRVLDVLQTDAAINPGNSGGALANIRGEIIGINTAKAMAFHIEGMGYAIPSNIALAILEQLLEDGTTPRPFLGISLDTIDEARRSMFALPSIGVIIVRIESGSPADEAGLVQGDLVVGFNQNPIETIDELSTAIRQSEVGEAVVLNIYRDGYRPVDVTVIVGNANDLTR
ncbi:MAG: trypsin-like peptidase domain-containing protein [Defluviitaleaceae bacterium]|nr:trypsin-like peptidase domain-containing protein [Defluviitaleaceae bacterium]